jgi:hypothetical protein
MNRMLALTSVVLIACQSPSAGSSGASATAAPSPSPSPTTRTETIELDFSEPGAVGRVLFRLPYGEGKGRVGYLPPCLKASCERPCPCSTQIQPVSFAPHPDGGVWVLDPVKERVARFSAQGGFVKKLAVPGNDLLNSDVVLMDKRLVVLGQRQRRDGDRISSLESGRSDTKVLRLEGDPVPAHSLTNSGGRLFTTVFVEDYTREIPVEVARDGTASEVPGVPFLDGWKHHRDFAGHTTIPLQVSSTPYNWSMEIDAALLREIDGKRREVPGTLYWEFVISEQGEIHLYIHAQTEKGGSIDADWLLTVSPEGLVGEPVKLRGPTGPDDQQSRHLALDPDDRPMAMWAGKKGLLFEALP